MPPTDPLPTAVPNPPGTFDGIGYAAWERRGVPQTVDVDMDGDRALEQELQGILQRTVDRLASTGARDEALGQFEQRRFLGIRGKLLLTPTGRAWRLGVLLLGRDGHLYFVGTVTRAVDPRHPNNQSISGEQRRAERRAAYEGGFAQGEAVNHGYLSIAVDAGSLRSGCGPLRVEDDELLVQWAPGQRLLPLEQYLAERAGLLGIEDGWSDR